MSDDYYTDRKAPPGSYGNEYADAPPVQYGNNAQYVDQVDHLPGRVLESHIGAWQTHGKKSDTFSLFVRQLERCPSMWLLQHMTTLTMTTW